MVCMGFLVAFDFDFMRSGFFMLTLTVLMSPCFTVEFKNSRSSDITLSRDGSWGLVYDVDYYFINKA